MKVKLTERALVQRIKRKLEKEQKCLKKSRGGPFHEELGDYYVVGPIEVVSTHVDIEALGRKLNVIKPFETLCF